MATILTYADIARAAYKKPVAFYPEGHLIQGWNVKQEDWEDGSVLLGNGFQGGVFQSNDEIIVGFAGTKNVGSDITADARIALNILPNQCTSAFKMMKRAFEIAKGRPVSCVGHSLGGALAQVMGVWCGVPFVTFNAPPMKNALRAAKVNIAKPHMMMRTRGKSVNADGINFRVDGDIVSAAGLKHVGRVITLKKKSGFCSHFMDICYELIESDPRYRGMSPLDLSA